MNRQFHIDRRETLLNQLPNQSLLLLFAGAAPHKSRDAAYTFAVNRNFYYVTGLDKERMVYVAAKANGGIEEFLFIEPANPDEEKWTGYRMRPHEASDVSGIEQVLSTEQLLPHLQRLLAMGDFEHVYFDLEHPEWQGPQLYANRFCEELQKRHPYLRVRNVYATLAAMRTVKHPEEVAEMKRAITITKAGIENILSHAQPGMYEYALAAQFDVVLGTAGVREHAFPTIMAGGPRATVLHYVENDQLVPDGDLVLADLGAAWNHYSADVTRTFPINGKFTDRQKLFYNIVLKAQAATIAAIAPGVTFQALNDVTKATLASELKAIGLIADEEEISKYYYHGVSHSLGLDTHDVGDKSWPIPAGAVITVEPGLYIAEENIGIRIEEDVLVTDTGCEVLTQDILKTVEEIEAFMATR